MRAKAKAMRGCQSGVEYNRLSENGSARKIARTIATGDTLELATGTLLAG